MSSALQPVASPVFGKHIQKCCAAAQVAIDLAGTWCQDAWLTSAELLAETERLKFLVAFRPALVEEAYWFDEGVLPLLTLKGVA